MNLNLQGLPCRNLLTITKVCHCFQRLIAIKEVSIYLSFCLYQEERRGNFRQITTDKLTIRDQKEPLCGTFNEARIAVNRSISSLIKSQLRLRLTAILASRKWALMASYRSLSALFLIALSAISSLFDSIDCFA